MSEFGASVLNIFFEGAIRAIEGLALCNANCEVVGLTGVGCVPWV